jgi:hypothetical protein
MKQKIIQHYKKRYSSSPVEINEEKIKILIEHDCECDNCGESIFELSDFPEVSIENDEVLCEDCFSAEYRKTCPICEDSYLKEDFTKYFFISKRMSKEVQKPHGLYKVLQYPLYYGDCVTGFDDFFEDALEKVSDIEINESISIIHPYSEPDIKLDCICPECAERYLRKDNFIKALPFYCIFQKKERNGLYKGYSDESIHRNRQAMVHQKITFRGILEKYNKQINII